MKFSKIMMISLLSLITNVQLFSIHITNNTKHALTIYRSVDSKVPVTLPSGEIIYNPKTDEKEKKTVQPGKGVDIGLDLANDQERIYVSDDQDSRNSVSIFNNKMGKKWTDLGLSAWFAHPQGEFKAECSFESQNAHCEISR